MILWDFAEIHRIPVNRRLKWIEKKRNIITLLEMFDENISSVVL